MRFLLRRSRFTEPFLFWTRVLTRQLCISCPCASARTWFAGFGVRTAMRAVSLTLPMSRTWLQLNRSVTWPRFGRCQVDQRLRCVCGSVSRVVVALSSPVAHAHRLCQWPGLFSRCVWLGCCAPAPSSLCGTSSTPRSLSVRLECFFSWLFLVLRHVSFFFWSLLRTEVHLSFVHSRFLSGSTCAGLHLWLGVAFSLLVVPSLSLVVASRLVALFPCLFWRLSFCRLVLGFWGFLGSLGFPGAC